jgi:hypothetical protein
MKTFVTKFLFVLIGLLIVNQISSQSKFEISAGIGAPEFYNLKIKYGHNLQAGICIGAYIGHGLVGSDKIIFQRSYAAEVSYHLFGKSKFIEQSPWYILAGLGYYDIPISDWYGGYDWGFYPRIGRTFNFSKRIGIKVDIGAFLPLSREYNYSLSFIILPSGCINFFIRF